MRTVCRVALSAALLITLTSSIFGAEPDSDRDRKARVALALAGRPAPVIAPAPRLAAPKDYATGYRVAAEQSRPLVVFVGCKEPHPAPGAVVARTDVLDDVTGPAAVVGYPVDGTLFVHTVMACPVEDGALKSAIDSAAKKIDRPAPKPAGDKPAPKPLSWEIRATTPPVCDCETCPHCGKSLKEAPAKDPEKAPAKAVEAECWDREGFPLRRTARGAYERIPGAAAVPVPSSSPAAWSRTSTAPSCSGGSCPTVPQYAFPQQYVIPAGAVPSCSNGRCPTPR